MTNLESLRSLQKHIREAKGADRELDFEILKALQDPDAISQDGGESYWTDTCEEHAVGGFETPYFTLDPYGLGSCVALMWETLPECRWSKTASGRYRVLCDGGFLSDADPLANDCLTFLDAIFSAAIAKEEAKEKADDNDTSHI